MQKTTSYSDLPLIKTTCDPLATTVEYPLVTPSTVDDNDKAWSLMYKAIIDGIGADPQNFQLIYPFMTWDWPVSLNGYTSSAQWDFISSVPQWSATGQYVSSGTTFDDAYQQMLNVVSAETSDPKLKADINTARNTLNLATNNYNTILKQAQQAYAIETGSTNIPTFTEWQGSSSGKSWSANLESAWTEVEAVQKVLNQFLRQTETPGLYNAQERYRNEEYYTKFQDPSLDTFPSVPSYSISMDATTWVNKVQSGTGGSSGTLSFSNNDSTYDYKDTWAGGSASVSKFFWSVNVGGSWQRIDEFVSDNKLEVTVEFEAWDQITIAAGRWYNGAFVSSIEEGPFTRGFSPRGNTGKAVWGKNGIMSLQKVGMIVCYKPSFEIQVSSSSFTKFLEKWNVSGGVRIGPFQFGGGGGSTTSGWRANSATNTFSGTSTSDTALIIGVIVNPINPLTNR
ncbi:MAG: hypothetical protein F6J94_14760 [Moorea sp. SIO1F2]|uniref:hypothetical protein n=1 Tax=Moorena sp. SIO1F2 TaxID=2607819 RepID=UPI0013B6BAE9|nr:hypothetical protein [Moorena sp. SIO1F2]NET83138.1 hypothetical protein [Moorena sp. SIO1F2]